MARFRSRSTGLLSGGAQVRVQPGALVPKGFADFVRENIFRRTFIELNDRSREGWPHSCQFAIGNSPSNSRHTEFSRI